MSIDDFNNNAMPVQLPVSSREKRLSLVIASLSSGGAERVMTTMANYWAAQGWHITLLTLDDGSEPPFFPLDTSVRHIPLDLLKESSHILSGIGNNLRRVGVLRQMIRSTRPDVVISFINTTNVLTILATRGLSCPVIVSEHTDPGIPSIGHVWRFLCRWFYRYADQVVMLNPNYVLSFPRAVQRISRSIPNPITPPPAIQQTNRTTSQQRIVISLGRLSEEKQFDLLIQAFARIAPDYPEWSIQIWGDGPLRANLEALRHELGLDERIFLPGRTKEPMEQLQQADLFVLPSRCEGFPNAVCEAMVSGLPVVVTNCSAGVRDIVRDGIDGILVPVGDVDALSQTLARLMGDANERQRLAARAPEVLERFGLESVMQQWNTLIHEVAS